MNDFPKVLILSRTPINEIDSAGASLRNWFKEWPKERLSQIYTGIGEVCDPFCGFNFQMGPDERQFGSLFYKLKSSDLGAAAQPKRQTIRSPEGNKLTWLEKAVYRTGNFLIQSGLWEIVFTPRLSSRLNDWINNVGPEVIFIQGTGVTFMRITLLLNQAYSIPVCLNVVDDWVEHFYKKSPVEPFIRGCLRDDFCRLARKASFRYTIGDLMAEEYTCRYGVPFRTLMQCGDIERFTTVRDERKRDWQSVEIVYSGHLGSGRWRSMAHLAEAALVLKNEGIKVQITAFTSFVPAEAEDILRKLPTLTLCDSLRDDEVPGILSKTDLLFLPESFDNATRSYIRLSVSTKTHLYMMSGRPILVYGPPEIGTVDYARREGWGYVVDQEGVESLVDALRRLLSDEQIRLSLIKKGEEVAQKNHDAKIVRERLYHELKEVVRIGRGSRSDVKF